MDEDLKITKSCFIKFTSTPVTENYTIQSKIGSGKYGHVYRAIHKLTGAVRAIKQIPKSRITQLKTLKAEVRILVESDHPNIIRLYEKIEDQKHVYLVMEECKGGELFDYINTLGSFSETDACHVFAQIVKAIKYLHT